MKQVTASKGFTLIELLVVIAIISILAGLLLPAVNGVRKKGYETQAKVDVKSLETAIRQYYAEYGRFPFNSGDPDKIYGKASVSGGLSHGSTDNADLIRVLQSKDGAGNAGFVNNPRKIVFLEVQEKSLTSNGDMIDPYNRQYLIAIDTDFDNSVTTGMQDIGTIPSRIVAVWSLGASGKTNTLITSWK